MNDLNNKSFVNPRKRPVVDSFSWLWVGFISFILASLIGYAMYLKSQSSFYIKMLDNNNPKVNNASSSVSQLQKKMEIYKLETSMHKGVIQSNELLKSSIKNLFDLVPDQITLTSVVMEKESLIIKGITKNKDSYNLLLLPPLKSIFNDSKVSFSHMPNGQYSFESINKIDTVK